LTFYSTLKQKKIFCKCTWPERENKKYADILLNNKSLPHKKRVSTSTVPPYKQKQLMNIVAGLNSIKKNFNVIQNKFK